MKTLFNYIPEYLKSKLRRTSFYIKHATRNNSIAKKDDIHFTLNQAPPIFIENNEIKFPSIGIIKTQEINFIEGYVDTKASWLRYERFCKNNSIPYGFYDISRSNWIDEASKYDIIICHTDSNPFFQNMIESKFYILENLLKKKCFPSYHELWQYEDKIRSNYLYQFHKLPFIPTKISYNKQEAFELINNSRYPFITKTSIGAGSTGVKLIKSKNQARAIIKKIFSQKGMRTQYPYQRQKNYFLMQEFISDASYDLRIILVSNMAFGYYRYPKKGDFRASGSGIVEKKAIPIEALKLAINIRNCLNSRMLGVDLLYAQKYNGYLIIETSLFNQIDTAEQLHVNGIPGFYDISDIENIKFKEGKFWVHELILRDIVHSWTILKSND